MGHTHRDSSLPAALLVGYAVDGPPAVRFAAGVLVYISSTWPDYDHPNHSRIHPGAIVVGGFARLAARTRGERDVVRADVHRGASHSIGGVLYLGLVTALVGLWVPVLTPWWWVWTLAVMTGSVVHIAGDCLTPSGCPIFWPVLIDKRRFHRHTLDVFSTGDDVNEPVVGMIVFRPAALLVGLWMTGLLDVVGRALFGDGRFGAVTIVVGWVVVAGLVLLVVRWLHHLGRRSRRAA